MTSVDDIARDTAERFGMFDGADRVLVMVSGGADSVALLTLFSDGVFGTLPVRALHVNHLLRGEAADADEDFVVALGGRLGIETRVVRYDVGEYARREGLNLEDAGRRIRYRFAAEELDGWARQQSGSPVRGRIAVAHTLDDRVETFFMRALFGAGAGGLASIAPVRDRIVRPLLGVERAALRAWLSGRGELWREDESNADTSRLRSAIRNDLLPIAEKISPAFRSALARSMDLLADDDALLSSMADAFARDFSEIKPGVEVSLERELMLTLDRTMARRTVRSALVRAFPEASRIEAEHVEALIDGLADERFARDLPYGLRVFGEYDKMIISRAGTEPPTVAPSLLSVPGKTWLGESGCILVEETGERDVGGSALSVVVDAGCFGGELTVDAPRPGDRMRPLGMEGSRKLSDLLIDAKVPKRMRAATPVVRDGREIVWLAGVRMSEDYRVTTSTTRCVRLTWDPDDRTE